MTTTSTATTAATAPVGRSVDELQGEVSNLRQQTVETNTQVKQIQQAITVSPPATANAAPKTIGEHVSVLETQLGDVRKNLSDNLGVHIHGLVDGTYDYNFNRPNTTPILSSSGSVDRRGQASSTSTPTASPSSSSICTSIGRWMVAWGLLRT